jgi:hypothetical protein
MTDPLDRLDTFMIGLLFFCGGVAIGIAILMVIYLFRTI